MFATRQQGMLRLHFLAQLAGLLALLGAFSLRPILAGDGGPDQTAFRVAAATVLIAGFLLEFLSRPAGLNRARRLGLSHRQCVCLLATLFFLLMMGGQNPLSGIDLLGFVPAGCLWIFSSNQYGYDLLDRLLYSNAEKGFSNTVLVGSAEAVRRFCSRRLPSLPPGTRVIGYVDVSGSESEWPGEVPRLGKLEELGTLCRQRDARALFLLDLFRFPELVPPLRELANELGVRVTWIEDVTDRFGIRSQASETQNLAVVTQIREPLEDPLNRAVKRAFDLFCSGLGILFLLPPAIALVALLQALRSPGPLFFVQQRSGRNGQPFRVFKFRSMHHRGNDRFRQAERNDPRVFRGGGFLRKSSIDELPQLLNVFLGQMSMVGPRPHPLSLDDFLVTRNREYRLRNLAKPGITGLAQCRGWRGETRDGRQIRNRVRLDIFYVRHWSLWLDLRILTETLGQLVKPPRSAF